MYRQEVERSRTKNEVEEKEEEKEEEGKQQQNKTKNKQAVETKLRVMTSLKRGFAEEELSFTPASVLRLIPLFTSSRRQKSTYSFDRRQGDHRAYIIHTAS